MGLPSPENTAVVQTRVVNGIHVVVLPDNTTSVDSMRVKDIIEDDLPIATHSVGHGRPRY